MAEKITRTDEGLWAECKQEAVESMGKFSARAMQRAVALYKERGGGYVGIKSKSNPLVAWNKKQETLKQTEE
jgi:predicted methyltransferase